MFDHLTRDLRPKPLLLLVSAWGLMLIIHGAVPFVLAPTLGQAVWSTGFSQSFVNQSLWTIYASNFGAPEPAAIAFGLPGAWLTALYIQLGLQPADAYSTMVASWMTLAMISAYALARQFSVKPALAVLAALGWMSMPVTWAHAGYSMLSIGIALLPMYFLAAVKLLETSAPFENESVNPSRTWRCIYPLICIIAIFMDGYSFMFFAVGASLLAGWWWLQTDATGKKQLTAAALPLHVASLLAAYVAYGGFIGKAAFQPSSLDFFRGWGADLTFFAIPTNGMHWLPDVLGWSMTRSGLTYFGDASVWNTTFSAPVILGSIWATWRLLSTQRVVMGLLGVACFGFYMAMGPSIKLNSVKPEGSTMGQMMPPEAALAPTGSGFLSEKLPGFNNMRASYRWAALGVLGAWALLVLTLSYRNGRSTRLIGASFMGVVILFNLPNLPEKWDRDSKYRTMFFQIDSDLVDDMRKVLHPGDKVAFLPWRNDFLVNYLAARLNVVSYNIGGDKNLENAKKHWPTWMQGFQMAQIDRQFTDRVVMTLASKEADAVILPYSDMLWAAHKWPYPQEFKEQMLELASTLEKKGVLAIDKREHYIALRLKPELQDHSNQKLISALELHVCPPNYCLKQERFDPQSKTVVGALKEDRLISQGQEGFLLFGPGAPLNPGKYNLTIYGSSETHETAWVDVSSRLGETIHGRFQIDPKDERVLLTTQIDLPGDIKDLEVRVYVGSEDNVQLDGYIIRLTGRELLDVINHKP